MAGEFSQGGDVGIDLGVLAGSPLRGMKRLRVDNRPTRVLRMEDFASVLTAAGNTDAYQLLLAMELTGMRPPNVRLLAVGEVEGKSIRIPPETMKGVRRCILPVCSYAAELLAACSARDVWQGVTGRRHVASRLLPRYPHRGERPSRRAARRGVALITRPLKEVG